MALSRARFVSVVKEVEAETETEKKENEVEICEIYSLPTKMKRQSGTDSGPLAITTCLQIQHHEHPSLSIYSTTKDTNSKNLYTVLEGFRTKGAVREIDIPVKVPTSARYKLKSYHQIKNEQVIMKVLEMGIPLITGLPLYTSAPLTQFWKGEAHHENAGIQYSIIYGFCKENQCFLIHNFFDEDLETCFLPIHEWKQKQYGTWWIRPEQQESTELATFLNELESFCSSHDSDWSWLYQILLGVILLFFVFFVLYQHIFFYRSNLQYQKIMKRLHSLDNSHMMQF
jgi:hypothetical protein